MIPDITIPANEWTDVYSLAGIPVGTNVLVVNKWGSATALLWEGATHPACLDGVPLRYPVPWEVTAGALGLWAYVQGQAGPVGQFTVQVVA